jgi:serine protease Do
MFFELKRFQFLSSATRWIATGALALAAVGVAATAAGFSTPVSAQVRGLPDFTELVEQVGPSVVNIRVMERTTARANPFGGGNMDEDMLEFFRRFGVPIPNVPRQAPRPNQAPRQEEERPRGVGSGFVLTSDGFIMTNAHVVEGADEVIVTLTDKREFKARIVGADRRTDVAVVKIEASGLPAVKVGDVNRLKVGEWVMAIGSPFGLDNTVTAGIVSAKQRDTGDYLPFIQTDVAINPGNSGGPLINMRGEVVGINSQIYSRTGSFAGISFAIPMDEAVRVSDQLRSSGRVQRGRIGVQIDQVTKDVAESLGLSKAQGALVRGVETGSPAEKAGIEAGDVITRFEGQLIDKSSDLPRIVGAVKPGTRSTLTVFRRGSSKDVAVVIGEVEPDRVAARRGDREERPRPSAAAQNLGLTVADLSDAQKSAAKVKGGVRIESVADAAQRAGLREGDVIVAVANVEIANLKEFEAVVGKADKTKAISVSYKRGEWVNFTMIRPVSR